MGSAGGRRLRERDDGRETGGAAPLHGEVGLEAEPSRSCRIGTAAAGEVESGVFCLVSKGDYTDGVIGGGSGVVGVVGSVVGYEGAAAASMVKGVAFCPKVAMLLFV